MISQWMKRRSRLRYSTARQRQAECINPSAQSVVTSFGGYLCATLSQPTGRKEAFTLNLAKCHSGVKDDLSAHVQCVEVRSSLHNTPGFYRLHASCHPSIGLSGRIGLRLAVNTPHRKDQRELRWWAFACRPIALCYLRRLPRMA